MREDQKKKNVKKFGHSVKYFVLNRSFCNVIALLLFWNIYVVNYLLHAKELKLQNRE